MQIIPSNPDGSYTMQIALSGVLFNLDFHWNSLNSFWVMGIYTANRVPVVLGIKIVPNYNLSGQYVYSSMPTGTIACQNFIGEWGEIGRFDMGDTTQLVYYEPGEFTSTSDLESSAIELEAI